VKYVTQIILQIRSIQQPLIPSVVQLRLYLTPLNQQNSILSLQSKQQIGSINNLFKNKSMFTSITWAEYLSFVVLILFVYYSVVAFRYYKWELLALAGIKRIQPASRSTSVDNIKQQFISENVVSSVSEHATALSSLKEELSALFANSSEMISATELINQINTIFQKYPADRVKDCRLELTHFIIHESNVFFPGLVQQDAVEQLWFG
jgi:hypothetical protein